MSIHVSTDRRATVVITGGSDEPPEFTKTEGRILRALIKRSGTVCTPRMFAEELYAGVASRCLPQQKIIDVKIYTIRKKLSIAGYPIPIISVWGRGYRLGDSSPAVLSDLIPDDLREFDRWVPSRKARILNLISDTETQRAVLAYFTDLSIDELTEWRQCSDGKKELPLRSTRAWLTA